MCERKEIAYKFGLYISSRQYRQNKIGSSEHSNQIARYADFIEKTYKNEDGYIKVFIYLTPNGEIPSDSHWNILRYSDIRDITDARLQYMKKFPSNFDSKIIELIRDYKDILSYVIISELNFQNRMKSFNSEFLEKDFPEAEKSSIGTQLLDLKNSCILKTRHFKQYQMKQVKNLI